MCTNTHSHMNTHKIYAKYIIQAHVYIVHAEVFLLTSLEYGVQRLVRNVRIRINAII